MARDYVKKSRTFWTGETGLAMSEAGPLVQLLADYLMSGPHWTVLGLYRLPLAFVKQDIRVSDTEIAGAMNRLSKLGYAHHDELTHMVWVVRYLAYQFGEELKPGDNRVKMLNKQWLSQPWNPHLLPFWRLYNASHHLVARADLDRQAHRQGAPPSLFDPLAKGLGKGLSKGLDTSVETPYASASASASPLTSAESETKGLVPAPALPASLSDLDRFAEPGTRTSDPGPTTAIPIDWWEQLLATYPRIERPLSAKTALLGVITQESYTTWPAVRDDILTGAQVLQRHAASLPREDAKFLLDLLTWIKELGWKGTDPDDGEATWRDNLRTAGEGG